MCIYLYEVAKKSFLTDESKIKCLLIGETAKRIAIYIYCTATSYTISEWSVEESVPVQLSAPFTSTLRFLIIVVITWVRSNPPSTQSFLKQFTMKKA
jgi:hypothetical protein